MSGNIYFLEFTVKEKGLLFEREAAPRLLPVKPEPRGKYRPIIEAKLGIWVGELLIRAGEGMKYRYVRPCPGRYAE